MSERSFTIIELIMVMAVLSILSVAVIPLLFTGNEDALELAAARFITDIRNAQSIAISTQFPVLIAIDPSEDSYQLYLMDEATTYQPMHDPSSGEEMKVRFNSGDYTGVGISKVDVDGRSADLIFNRWGNPFYPTVSQAVLQPFANNGTITLTYKNTVRTLTVEAGTGYIHE